MIEGFENLTEEQFKTCKDAISWITAMIASSDGKIDQTETAWSAKITKIRSYSSSNNLTSFYEEVGKDFADVLADVIQRLPSDHEERMSHLGRQLSKLNVILALLDNTTAYQLYNSYTSFAKHVAKSSGGFLGFFSISSAEKKLMVLPTVNEIVYIGEEEE